MSAAINTGGQAFPACSRCALEAVRLQGHQWLCAKHYRFGQMRASAKRHGKAVPSHQELETMAASNCRDCGVRMNWLASDGQATVASLQHYRDGTLALVCRSCNTRHAHMPGDSFRDIPKDHKLCPQCAEVKPFDAYSADCSRSGPMKLKSWCKDCSAAAHFHWQSNNRDHLNEQQRARRARQGGAS